MIPETYQNPIIPGDWSDPALIRVGHLYYTLRSSFGWKPGLQIMDSPDLVHWRPAGCIALDNLPMMRDGTSEGGLRGSDLGFNPNTGKFVVYSPVRELDWIVAWQADRVEGPWDGPHPVVEGYDPGFFADDEVDPATGARRLYLVKTGAEVFELAPDGLSIRAHYGKITPLGSEGPALFKREGCYYFIASDGGTRPGQRHDIYTLRTDDLRRGPWEADPANPQMQANAETNARLQGPGHGTLVRDDAGNWFVAYHAFEITHYSLGRQACLDPVEWTADGWWRPAGGRIPCGRAARPVLPWTPEWAPPPGDEFDRPAGGGLGPAWFGAANPAPEGSGWSLWERPGWLRLRPGPGPLGAREPGPQGPRHPHLPWADRTFFQRVTHKRFDALTQVDFDPQCAGDEAGLLLYHDPGNHIAWAVGQAGRERILRLGVVSRGTTRTLWTGPCPGAGSVWLKVAVDGEEAVRFFSSPDGVQWTEAGPVVYFGDSGRDLRGGRGGDPDLGWVAESLEEHREEAKALFWKGSGARNRWTGAALGLYAVRDKTSGVRCADFNFLRVISHPCIDHPCPRTPDVAALPVLEVVAGRPFRIELTAGGGTEPLVWAAHGLPPGVVLESGGTLQGCVAEAGTHGLEAEVVDARGETHRRAMVVRVTRDGGTGDGGRGKI